MMILNKIGETHTWDPNKNIVNVKCTDTHAHTHTVQISETMTDYYTLETHADIFKF